MNVLIKSLFFTTIFFFTFPVLAHNVPQEVFDALPCSETPCEIDGTVYDNLTIYKNTRNEWMIVYFQNTASYENDTWTGGHIINTIALGNSRYNTVLNSVIDSKRQFYTFSDGQIHIHPAYTYVYHWEADPSQCISDWYSTTDLLFLRYAYNYTILPFADPEYFCGELENVEMADVLVKASEGVATDGASSVLFLPGHQGSRLYRTNEGKQEKLWEPLGRRTVRLFLNEEGESVEDIYVQDIIDEAYGDDIYKDFIQFMNELRDDGVIAGWQAHPYDWRLSLDTLVNDELIARVEALAQNSQTGKVSLIAHSNGGLLGKLLVEELETQGKGHLVDRLIMVGTPQLGTPKALASLLHGEHIGFFGKFILNRETVRTLGENMISAYTLLPFRKYFDVVDNPVIRFDQDVVEIHDFLRLYGGTINEAQEMHEFLLGDNGERTEPENRDTDSPNVLDQSLLSRAVALQERLMLWEPPEDLEIIQLAGWGLDTIAGIKYDDCDVVFCPDKLSNLDREVFFGDGDGTVISKSAIMKYEETYYLNLLRHNDNERDIKHSAMMESQTTQDLIWSILKNVDVNLEYVTKAEPSLGNDRRLRFSMHSPVELHLYSSKKHTGITEQTKEGVFYEEQIPNSYYAEIGEKKYAGMPGDSDGIIALEGEELGAFTFEIDDVVGGEIVETLTFADIPVTEHFRAKIDISDGEAGDMEIDSDGDDKIDVILKVGEEISKSALIGIFIQNIETLSLEDKIKKKITGDLFVIEKHYIDEETIRDGDEKLGNLQKYIEKRSKKGDVSESVASELIIILERIRLNSK